MVKEFRILKLFIWINETNTEYILFVYKGALKAVQSTGPSFWQGIFFEKFVLFSGN